MAYTPDEWIAMRTERAAQKAQQEREQALARLAELAAAKPTVYGERTRKVAHDLMERQSYFSRRST
jgi:hypothetical protein